MIKNQSFGVLAVMIYSKINSNIEEYYLNRKIIGKRENQ